jgi:hypothetical protein
MVCLAAASALLPPYARQKGHGGKSAAAPDTQFEYFAFALAGHSPSNASGSGR